MVLCFVDVAVLASHDWLLIALRHELEIRPSVCMRNACVIMCYDVLCYVIHDSHSFQSNHYKMSQAFGFTPIETR